MDDRLVQHATLPGAFQLFSCRKRVSTLVVMTTDDRLRMTYYGEYFASNRMIDLRYLICCFHCCIRWLQALFGHVTEISKGALCLRPSCNISHLLSA